MAAFCSAMAAESTAAAVPTLCHFAISVKTRPCAEKSRIGSGISGRGIRKVYSGLSIADGVLDYPDGRFVRPAFRGRGVALGQPQGGIRGRGARTLRRRPARRSTAGVGAAAENSRAD